MSLRNLAGKVKPDTDSIITAELTDAGIEAYENPLYEHPEVKTKVNGYLKADKCLYRFTRNWTYWVVRGRVPTETAERIYAGRDKSVYGERPFHHKQEIRAGGDAGCRPPSLWSRWYKDGREIADLETKQHFEDWVNSTNDGPVKAGKIGLKSYIFSDSPETLPGAEQFVTEYHIDTTRGLSLFVEYVKGLR